MRNITFGTILTSILVLGLTNCGTKKEEKEVVKHVNVIEARDMNDVVPHSFTGRTKSNEEVNVSFRVSGTLQSLRVKEGDYVKKGQVVATMDSRDYQLQVAATQAEYEQIKADCERVIALYEQGNTTAQNYDKARYGLQQISQKLSNHKNQLSDCYLKAPISGYVKNKLHEAGETVGAGMPVMTITGAGSTEVEIKIPASDFASREKFTNYECTFSTIGDQKFPLELLSVSPEANANQLFTMRFAIKGNYDRSQITPGMTCMVYASVATEISGIISIPSTAVLSKDGKTSVFIYNNGVVEQKYVEVMGLRTDGTTLVKNGIKQGERVVTTGIHHIKNGSKVEVLKNNSKTNVGGLL